MAIILRNFASGDTDYIAKLNQNNATLTGAIDLLQLQAGSSGAGSAISVVQFFDALFNAADGLIGPGSYYPTQGASTISVAAGGMYLTASQMVVSKLTTTTLNFAGQTSDTYYIIIDATGIPSFAAASGSGACYSVVWNGSAFVGDPELLVGVLMDMEEATDARTSDALGTLNSPPDPITYMALDDRLEAGEAVAVQASEDATQALADAAAALAIVGVLPIRKVGCSVDDTTGLKGAIQIDFAGIIIGWSVIADAVGDLEVEVSRAASSAPPADPAIPDPVTDLITASAPIELAAAQSAATDDTGVSTWDVDLAQWDVVQFNVVTVTTITRATLYLRIQEI